MLSTVKSPIIIKEIDHVDLDSNLVIEASAGTGKTYAIEHLVVNLLKHNRVKSLDKILVVTFTEKATSELKERIRQKIEETLKDDNSKILQDSLDNFDTASIYTIHGFCNRILRHFAFENGEQFQFELVEDKPIYEKMLHKQMREYWPIHYGNQLSDILQMSKFPQIDKGISKWEKRVIDIAMRYHPANNDEIIPDINDILKQINEYELFINDKLDTLSNLVGYLDENNVYSSELYINYSQLNINIRSIEKRLRDMIVPLLELISNHRKNCTKISDIVQFFSNKSISDDGFYELNSGWKKPGPDYQEKLPALIDMIDSIEEIRSLDLKSLSNQLAVSTIHQLKNDVSEYKKKHGYMSYDDMISLVSQAIDAEDNSLNRVLQNRYHYALVDEFQDTDMMQWNIFKKIFLQGKLNKLFIIGDPKQAIYGFRGADIYAYYTAKEEMLNTYNAKYYSLNYNWRSVPGLIHIYNKLFNSKNWFLDDKIIYLDNYYPENNDKNRIYCSDPDNFFIVNLGTCSGTEARYRMAQFTASEIKNILRNNQYNIAPHEIAILIRKWNEAVPVEQVLKENNIKYSYYKKEGLYQSKEAAELTYLLAAIAKPGDARAYKKALLTRFFNVPLKDIKKYETIPQTHAVSELIKKWNILAMRREWARLFQSIMKESKIVYNLIENNSGDRTISNLNQIIQNLEVEAYRNNHDIKGIMDYFNHLKNDMDIGDDDYNLHKPESDDPGVQIMTIHASKGLQFKVVFIAGGFTKKYSDDYWVYHNKEKRIFDINKDDKNEILYNNELDEEEKRLFYVALTRSIYRVYIPQFEPSNKKGGIAGSFFKDALQAVCEENHVKNIDYDDDDKNNDLIMHEPEPSNEIVLIPEELFPERALNFLDRRIFIESFSSLKSKKHTNNFSINNNTFGDIKNPVPGEDDDLLYGFYQEASNDTYGLGIEGLPRGKETGSMLHEILQGIEFSDIAKIKNYTEILKNRIYNKLIEEKINRYMINHNQENFNLYKEETARIIWNTLIAPLDDTGFKLCELTGAIHEMEFYFPYSGNIKAPGIAYTSGKFIHGFIDLVFEYKNRIYILDWKSTHIENGYSIEAVTKDICDSHYDLQYMIYSFAALKWLKQTCNNFNYDEHFGGIYYIYLRGMDIVKEKSGVFFYRPQSEDEILEYNNSIM